MEARLLGLADAVALVTGLIRGGRSFATVSVAPVLGTTSYLIRWDWLEP